MSRITLELGATTKPHACECCGRASHTVVGYAYADNDAYAIYYAGWTDGHLSEGAKFAIGIGSWDEGTGPEDRTAIGMILTIGEDAEPGFAVTDQSESPWADAEIVGSMLDREEALAHPRINEVFHVADHVVLEDPRVKRAVAAMVGGYDEAV